MILGVDLDNREVLPGISVHFMVKEPPLDRLAALVQFLAPFVNEFVIVDTNDDERYVERMESWSQPSGVPVRVIRTPFVDFSTSRNVGLAEHKHEWTLGLDPDEIPSFNMIDFIVHQTLPGASGDAMGYVFWTYNWWDGIKGEEAPYHWHTRLWKTKGSYLYRPIHELVKVCGVDELTIRNTISLPHAPKEAYLIHSKGRMEIERDDAFYATMGEVSR